MGCCQGILGAEQIDAAEAAQNVKEEAPDILIEDEEIEFAFKTGPRDTLYFTNYRCLVKDKQGITGSKICWSTWSYDIIKAVRLSTAGTLDFTAELHVWASGMGDFEITFRQSKSDIFALQRFINSRVFHPENLGKKLAAAPDQENMPGAVSDDAASRVFDLLGDNARVIDAAALTTQLQTSPPVLDPDETIELAYKCGRDVTALTSHRCLMIDVQGLTGKKVVYTSYMWKCLRAFAVETAGGIFDQDSEMRIWTNIPDQGTMGGFEQDLRKGVDVMAVQKFFTDKLLGPDTSEQSQFAASAQDGGAGWQSLFAGDQRMIDAGEADRTFHTTTPILQNSEVVEMAFKGARDMMLFTTKRLVLVDKQGWTGKSTAFTSIPWKTVQCFAVQTASGMLDKDSEMMLWTDIMYGPPKEEGEPCEPGMSYIEQDFVKDKVDIATIGRYLADRCAPLGKDAGNPPMPTESLVAHTAENGLQEFLSIFGNDFRQVDPQQIEDALRTGAPLILPNEKVHMAFTCGSDKFVLTSHRAIVIDSEKIRGAAEGAAELAKSALQGGLMGALGAAANMAAQAAGISGKQVQYLSIPYTKIKGFMVESAGSWDMDADMEFFISAPYLQYQQEGRAKPVTKIDFGKANADIMVIQKVIASQLIGNSDGTAADLGIPVGLKPPSEPGNVGKFLDWIGTDYRQISAEETEEKLRSEPQVLLDDESVQLAFRCVRDLVVFTSKRQLVIDVQGFTGKKVAYVSIPWKLVSGFSVTNPGTFDTDAEVDMVADGAGGAHLEVKAGMGDFRGCYKLLLKKAVFDRQQQ